MRLRHARVGRFREPFDASGKIGGLSFAAQQHHRQIELRQSIALSRSGFVRGERLGVVAAPVRLPAGAGARLQRRRHQHCRDSDAGHTDRRNRQTMPTAHGCTE